MPTNHTSTHRLPPVFSLVLFCLSLLVVILAGLSLSTIQTAAAVPAEDSFAYLPLVVHPVPPEPIDPVLLNHSFEEGWTDLPPAPGNLINQQPTNWIISFVPIGETLFNFGETANGIPESIHKRDSQLPPHEQPICEGPDDENCCDPNTQVCTPLILEGEWVYKSFHFAASFGTTLTQTLSVPAGAPVSVTVPIQIHNQQTNWGDFDAGVRLMAEGASTDWIWLDQIGDRSWYEANIIFTSADETAVLRIDFVSRYNLGKDFFIDDLKIGLAPAGATPTRPDPTRSQPR